MIALLLLVVLTDYNVREEGAGTGSIGLIPILVRQEKSKSQVRITRGTQSQVCIDIRTVSVLISR